MKEATVRTVVVFEAPGQGNKRHRIRVSSFVLLQAIQIPVRAEACSEASS
jgi:hypothetical protein